MAGRGRNPVDIIVGRNIRIQRLNRGLSQTDLGAKIGVTFQQVQKYENGANRVGSGRLFRIAGALELPVTALFAGADQSAENADDSSPMAMLTEPYALRVLTAFCSIVDPELRRSLAEFTEKFASKLDGPVSGRSKNGKRTMRGRSPR